MRLDKCCSSLGLLTRSECRAAVKKGRITINGERAASPDRKVDPDCDIICLDGRRIEAETYVYYLMNKPAGVITARSDQAAPVVFDYVSDPRPDLTAVGRLDKDTTGLLLLTNDGELNHRLLSPGYHVEKTYQVWIDGALTEEDILLLREGMDIGDEKPTLPARVAVPGAPDAPVELTITEGRYHQVKRMFGRLGKPVIRLHRCTFGPLSLDPTLKPGDYRRLTSEELKSLKTGCGSKKGIYNE